MERKRKKNYESPEVVRVKLVFEEAVLTACKQMKHSGPHSSGGAGGCVNFTHTPINCFEPGT